MRMRLASLLGGAVLACAFGLGGGEAFAGNQKEEALSDSVRLALANAIADARPPRPAFRTEAARARYHGWLDAMSGRLVKRMPDVQTRTEFLETVWYESTRAGLDPGLVLGLIQVESAYRKYAISIADGDRRRLFHMQTNLRYGCAILRMYIDMERGDLYLALGRYNGSRGKPKYPNAVLAAWKNWEFKHGI